MNITLKDIALLMVIPAILLLVAIVIQILTPKAGATGFQVTTISAATTSTAYTITTSRRILATSTNPLDGANSHMRTYATICNPNANLVYLNLNDDIAAGTSTAT